MQSTTYTINHTTYQLELLMSLLSIGSLDLGQVATTLENVREYDGSHFDEFLEYLDGVLASGVPLQRIDLNGHLHDYLLDTIQWQVYEWYQEQGLPAPNFGSVYVYHNYYCSGFDCWEDMKEVILTIPEQERPALAGWFLDQID